MKEREERKRKGEREKWKKREKREGGLRECGRGREWKRECERREWEVGERCYL